MKFTPWPVTIPCQPRMYSWPHLVTDTATGFFLLLSDATKCYVELGTWCGGSAWYACQLAPRADIICVDAWDGRGGPGGQYQPEIASQSMQLTQANLWDFRDRTHLLESDTLAGVEYLQSLPEIASSVDVCYIDADHSYEGALADIEACLAAFPSAVICGDDYLEWCGRAADDVFGKQIRVIGDHFWWAA